MGYNFNRKQSVRALVKLGFKNKSSRRGKHDKYEPPEEIKSKLSSLQPQFIIIPRHNELKCQNEIVKELNIMGGEELVERFINFL